MNDFLMSLNRFCALQLYCIHRFKKSYLRGCRSQLLWAWGRRAALWWSLWKSPSGPRQILPPSSPPCRNRQEVCTYVPDSYAQRTHQFLMRMLSVYASVPDTHAQCTHQFLTRMLRAYKINILRIGKLMRMLSRCVWSACPVRISS